MPNLTKVCVNCSREKPINQFRLKATYLRKPGNEHTAMCNVCATLRSIKGKASLGGRQSIYSKPDVS